MQSKPGVYQNWKQAAPLVAFCVFGCGVILYYVGVSFGWWGMP